MGEIGGDDYIESGPSGDETSSRGDSGSSEMSQSLSENVSTTAASEVTVSSGPSEGVSISAAPSEVGAAASSSSKEMCATRSVEGTGLSESQAKIDAFGVQTRELTLMSDGKYMSENDQARIANGMDVRAVPYREGMGYTGCYRFANGRSSAEICTIDDEQMERSTTHEWHHFMSHNNEIIVPDPDRNGYWVHNTVGTRQSSWFHSNRTGEISDYSEKGRGLNEGLTTMYTNRQLGEIDPEKGRRAEQQDIYGHSVDVCKELEDLVGEDALKEAYYGGNKASLESAINEAAGDGEYDRLVECMDRTVSDNYYERAYAMSEAQDILAKVSEYNERKEKS